jgi:hypothetical protein
MFADRLSLLHTAGTIREQLGTDMLAQPATSAASCMVILEHNRRNRQLFSPFSPICTSIALKKTRVRVPPGPLV